MRWRIVLPLLGCLTLLASGQARAQGLLWSLPPDGSWVRYEGTFSQLVRRPNSTEGDLQLQWTRHVTIKSVGTVEEEFRGAVQPCRWIEIKVVTGQVKEGLIDAGPGGVGIYKLLVPEQFIRGQQFDDANILVSYIPVARGYRQLGEESPQPVESGVFQLYPYVEYLHHYRNLEPDGAGPQPLQIPLGDVTATLYRGSMTTESTITRATNEGQIWRSEDVPFGVAKWVVRDVREEKHPTQSRDLFRETTEVSIEMAAHATGTDAETELDVP
jgi:hypothetical protein